MGDFDLDLRTVEEGIDESEGGKSPTGAEEGEKGEETADESTEHNDQVDSEDDHHEDIVLATLDGTTDPAEWIDLVSDGTALVLDVEGDLNELAAGFAREIRNMDGGLVHFRGFLIVSPPGTVVDTSRLD